MPVRATTECSLNSSTPVVASKRSFVRFSHIKSKIDAMRKAGLVVKDIFVIFYYDIFNFEKSILSKLNVDIHSLCTWRDIISVMEKRNLFSQTNIENLKEFLSGPDEWRIKNA